MSKNVSRKNRCVTTLGLNTISDSFQREPVGAIRPGPLRGVIPKKVSHYRIVSKAD